MAEPGFDGRQAPILSQRFNSGHDYRSGFGELKTVFASEGGVAYTADRADGFYVIMDESILAEFMDDLEPLVTIMQFDSAEARDQYCKARFGHFRRSQLPF